MKMVAIPYLQQTIKDVVIKIMDCKQPCEVRFNSIQLNAIQLNLLFVEYDT